MSKKKDPEARWIRINGHKTKIPTTEPSFIFYPYEERFGLKQTENRINLLLTRPILPNYSKRMGRYCKDKVYKLMAAHCGQHSVSGPYVGLAAQYSGEIFANFYPFIKGQFYTYELDTRHYERLLEYQPFIEAAYPPREGYVDFVLEYGDIIEGLQNTKSAAIIDLDFMGGLGKKDRPSVKDVVNSVVSCATKKSVLAVWQTTGRHSWTNKELEDKVRPALRKALKKHFRVLQYDKVDYWEGYPMRVDIYTLERVAA